MPLALPYPISGKVYEKDGSTAVVGMVITAFNATKQKWLENGYQATTDINGDFAIDAFKFLGGYDNGDVIQIIGISTRISVEARHTIDTGVGALTKNLIIRHGAAYCGDVYLKAVIITNNYVSTKALYVDLYNRKDVGSSVIRICCPFGDTKIITFPDRGKMFYGGISPIFEDETAGRMECLLVVDNKEE